MVGLFQNEASRESCLGDDLPLWPSPVMMKSGDVIMRAACEVGRLHRNRRVRTLCCFVLALFLSLPAGAAQISERVSIFGYFDLETEFVDTPDQPDVWTFDQHHLNLLTMFEMTPRWRALANIEYEHGPSVEGGDGSGEIAVEEGWIAYRHGPGLEVRAGKILAPFGLYNHVEDRRWLFHFTELPEAVYGKHRPLPGLEKQRLYSKFATGLAVRMQWFFDNSNIEVQAYLSNGRGERPAEADGNANKGAGWRMAVTSESRRWRLGHSLYADRNGAANDSKQTHVGFDITFAPRDFDSGWVILAEANLSRIDPQIGGTPTVDYRGAYVDVLYKTQSGWIPWVRLGHYDEDRDTVGDSVATYGAGVAYELNDKVSLKASFRWNPQTDRSIALTSVAARF